MARAKALFWLDNDRAHDANLITLINKAKTFLNVSMTQKKILKFMHLIYQELDK